MIDPKERYIIRQLAVRYREKAVSQENIRKKAEWVKHNNLKGERPMLLIFPEDSWEQLVPSETLKCSTPFLRSVEASLRRALYHIAHFRDDRVYDPVLRFPAVFDERVDWNLGVRRRSTGEGAYIVEPTLKGPEDLEKMISTPHRWEFDDGETERRESTLQEILNGILPVEPILPFYTGSIIFRLTDLRGLTNMMMDLIDRPDFFHKVMTFMKDETIANYRQIEAENRVTSNNCDTYLPSGSHGFCDFLPGPEKEKPVLNDIWGFADTQEFTDVSPSMWREFVLPYQKKVLSLFGAISYGCCENLNQKIDDILSIENIRKISVSPWSDPELLSEKIGNRVVYCRKPNPSDVIYNFDPRKTRREIRDLMRTTRQNDNTVEIVLKDLITCNGHPEHYTQWVEEARLAIGL